MNIITVILLVILIAIIAVFWIRSKITALVSSSLKIGFVFFTILSLVGIFLPQFYDLSADFVLRQSGTYQQIQSIDETVPLQNIIDAPGNIIDQFNNIFGGEQEETKETEEDVGFFESTIYPTFLSVTSFLLRIFSLIISFAGLILIVYLSYITTTVTDTENLKKKVKDLEARIKLLESNDKKFS